MVNYCLNLTKKYGVWSQMNTIREDEAIRRRVLVVDDEFINREILGNMLSKAYSIEYAENAQIALDKLMEPDAVYSLVLLDLMMPVMGGIEFLERRAVSDRLKRIPVVVMTSENDYEIRCLKLGAADFIKKPFNLPEVVLARCERIVELFEDKNLIRHTERDSVTGLFVKDYFFEYIRQMERWGKQIPRDALVIDIEQFHLVNDFCGRPYGNFVLSKIGKTMKAQLASMNAIACRADADTFYVFASHQEDYSKFREVLDAVISKFFQMNNIRLRYGIWENVSRDYGIEDWFDRAKIACNSNRGDFTKSFAHYNNELHARYLFEETLIHDLDDAIANKDLKVYYQPKYNVVGSTPRLASAEALVRWIHPKLGFINPGDFIPLFESNGLIQKVDNYVWHEAAAQIRRWKEEHGTSIPVSVNVSRINILDPELESKLENIRVENGLSPEELMLEVTESAYSENTGRLIEVVERLRQKGFRIEIDDFGAGYSSLNMITSIPVDILKIDMSFIRNMEKDERNLKLVKLIIDIAKFLKVPSIAEGVETESQLATLKKMGCEIIQGFYFSKPVPPKDFVSFFEGEAETRK